MAARDIYETTFDEDEPLPNQYNIETETCPECAGVLRTRSDETFCEECGLVTAESRIDLGAEWSSFEDNPESNPSRVGAPRTETRHDYGLSTEIGWNWDSKGRRLSETKQRRFGRLRREHRRAILGGRRSRTLIRGFQEIHRVVAALDLPRWVRVDACGLLRRAQNEGLFPGRSVDALAAAAVYATCRCETLPWTPAEVAEVAHCSRSSLQRMYQVLNLELELPARPLYPEAYVPRFASELDVPERVRREALDLAALAADGGVSNGRNPAGVAAACLYVAAKHNGLSIRQVDAAAVARTTAVTVRASIHELDGMG